MRKRWVFEDRRPTGEPHDGCRVWRWVRGRSRTNDQRRDEGFVDGGRNAGVDRVLAPSPVLRRDACCIRGSGPHRIPSRMAPRELLRWEAGAEEGDLCAGAEGPMEHDHFFTTDGAFGSHDQNGEEVDGGDFELVDRDTVSFPSHAEEFGYDGVLVVDYTVSGDVVTFEVALPDPCVDSCADAYAWALSAFASGPWERGEGLCSRQSCLQVHSRTLARPRGLTLASGSLPFGEPRRVDERASSRR